MDESKKIEGMLAKRERCACGAELEDWQGACHACIAGMKAQRAAEDERWHAEQRAAEDERQRRRLEDARATIPEAFAEVRFGQIQLAARVKRSEAVQEALAAREAGIVLLAGGAGAGKTTIAAALMHDVIDRALAGDRRAFDRAITSRWCAALTLERARREHRLGDGDAPEVRRALEASLLVIDDLGQEASDRDRVLTDVIYERHASRRPTIITTGLSRSDLQRYGDGIARRLTERPAAAIVRCAVAAEPAKAGGKAA